MEGSHRMDWVRVENILAHWYIITCTWINISLCCCHGLRLVICSIDIRLNVRYNVQLHIIQSVIGHVKPSLQLSETSTFQSFRVSSKRERKTSQPRRVHYDLYRQWIKPNVIIYLMVSHSIPIFELSGC